MLRNWLINKLGGFSEDTKRIIELDFDEQLIKGDSEIQWLREQLNKEIVRCETLQRIIFEKFGVVNAQLQSEQSTPAQLKPLQVTNENWARRKNRLEREDAQRAADAVERHWREKDAKVGEGI